MHLVQLIRDLGHPGMRHLLYVDQSVRRFAGPTFRHLREKHPPGEGHVCGNTGCQGAGKREETGGVEAGWPIAMKAGRRRRLDRVGTPEAVERRKTPVRARVEHPSLAVRHHFGYAKVR